MTSPLRAGRALGRAPVGVVRLDDARARDPEVAGAKAAALAAATRAGLPVLPGIVLTTGFDPDLHRGDLREAWAELTSAGARPVVVRSSSTVEDAQASSMAGMFTSLLEVSGWDAFLAAVDTVLSSAKVVPLVPPAARRQAQAPMAVLVQPHLAAACGGVLFGLDPVSGRHDRLVVAATGDGPAALVSGRVEGTRYVLTRLGRLVEGVPGLLTRSQLRELAHLAGEVRRVFGSPQDVEWAYDAGGQLHLLQSRPVTAQGDAATARGPVFGPGPVAETFPEPLAPLEEDLWAWPLRQALRHALALAGTAPRRKLSASPVLASVGGRLAVDLDVLPGNERHVALLARLDPIPAARRLVAAWRVGRVRAALPKLASDLVGKADADLLSIESPAAMPDESLLDVLAGARHALVALHGHEVLTGWLVDTDGQAVTVTAASVAIRRLASARGEGLADEEIAAREPSVLALVPPRIAGRLVLPAPPDVLPPPAAAPPAAGLPAPALLREALRLRARWVQELTARVAWELGTRLAARGVLEAPEAVRLLRLDELAAVVAGGAPPEELAARAPAVSPPLPARFRLTAAGRVVAVEAEGAGGDRGQGAGGGRAAGIVHDPASSAVDGTVLVVRTLDPDLAPLLPRLAGLVAETGSPLSHLAILARELGVPTAVGVPGATLRFPPGALVVVDGITGVVERIDKQRGAG